MLLVLIPFFISKDKVHDALWAVGFGESGGVRAPFLVLVCQSIGYGHLGCPGLSRAFSYARGGID